MATPPMNPNSGARRRQWWIAHPLVGFIGTFASLIGLPLAAYFYLAAQATRDLRITSDPSVAIVRAGQASPVDIVYHGEKIMTDVYARQVYVWNAGSDSIRRENVLESIGISIRGARILGARVKKVTRPLIKLVVVANPASNGLMLSWNILEHNDGAAIEVIYAASDSGMLAASGAVEHHNPRSGFTNTKQRAIPS
jgi:hypothetical protein